MAGFGFDAELDFDVSLGINAGANAGTGNTAEKTLGSRKDPYTAFNFLVEIEGIVTGGFNDVSGIDVNTEYDSIREGGVNDHVHKLPKWTTQSDLVLKKGLTDIDSLWNWHADVVAGNIVRKNGSIYLIDRQSGAPAVWWDFIDAYPVKWVGPSLNASTGTVAFETLTLVHNGLTKPKANAGQASAGISASFEFSASLGF